MIKLIMVMFILVVSIIFLSLSYAYAEDWTQIGYSGIQGFITESGNNSAIGIMGFMNLELKHSHPKSWLNYYNRMGLLGALEYYPNNQNLSGTIQFPFYSYWTSKENLFQMSIGFIWAEAKVEYKETKIITYYDLYGIENIDTEVRTIYKNETVSGMSLMVLFNYKYSKSSFINSGLLFLRVDNLRKVETRAMIGLSFGHSLLERFSD